MTVKNLTQTSFEDVLACFLAAFGGYALKMPTDPQYHKDRWRAAKVDFALSYGMFDGDKLVGFLIHGIDVRDGVLMAFNTATGVIPAYRGKGVVDALYAYALPDLRQHGVQKTTLEVITTNEVAVRAYLRNGFGISKTFHCFRGTIAAETEDRFEMETVSMQEVDWDALPNQQSYCWDHRKETLLERDYKFFCIRYNGRLESYFIMDPDRFYLQQFDVLTGRAAAWNRLFAAIRKITETVTVINVDDRLVEKLAGVRAAGLESLVDLYEMELSVPGE